MLYETIDFSSGKIGRLRNIDRMVRGIMEKSGQEDEFVKLIDLVYSGCKNIFWLCAKPQTCMLEDGSIPYYQKIKQADAIVVGSPVHGGEINGDMAAFLDRYYGFKHVTKAIENQPFSGVLCGYRITMAATERMRRKLGRVQLQDVLES